MIWTILSLLIFLLALIASFKANQVISKHPAYDRNRNNHPSYNWVGYAFVGGSAIVFSTTWFLFQTLAKPLPKQDGPCQEQLFQQHIPYPNEFGDAFGGILNPLVAFLAAGLTFMAFWIQYQANKLQRDDITRERFDNKFYEMVRLHRENVSEINIAGKHSGRKAFVKMYQEFQIIYQVVSLKVSELKNSKHSSCCPKYTAARKTELSYIILFFGTGEISDLGLRHYTKDFDSKLVYSILKVLKKCQKKYSSKKNNTWQKFNLKIGGKRVVFEVDFYPFDGHMAKLGHYFRHLYQTIKLAATHPALKLADPREEFRQRYEYVKLLRVQLSNHEQAMIYFNSFFIGGKVWWSDDTIEDKTTKDGTEYPISYFLDYGMIKNLPFNLTNNIGPNPIKEFTSHLLNRGFSMENQQKQNELKDRLNELFEWQVKDKTFRKLVQKIS